MRRRLATLVAVGALLGGMLVTGSVVLAANQAANLDQCANDPAPSDPTNGCDTSASQWVNGNLGASKSIYREGDSIAYRMRFTNLATSGASAAHTVIVEYDTTKGGKHAIDYLTTWNRTVTTANPCLGVSGCALGSPSSTRAIPVDGQVKNGPDGAAGGGDDINPGLDGTSGTADDLTNCTTPNVPCTGVFTMWGGNITSVSAISYPNGGGFAGDKTARLSVSFTATVGNPVLAWGGHIATRQNWPGASAINISGSPYHMRLIDLDGAGGNQDRSLSADAVIFPASITIIKDATPNGSTVFPFTASPSPLTGFNLVDDGTAANTKLFSGILVFDTYVVAETKPANWDLTGRTCTGFSNGGTFSNNGATGVNIVLKEGENVTCTFSNAPTPAPSLSVTKIDDGDTFDTVGDVIDYTITVANTGNVALTNVVVTDTNAVDLDCDGTAGTPFTTTIPSIAVGGSVDCTARHVVTQADIDAGSYSNEACADDGDGGAAGDCGDVTTPGDQNPSLLVTKVDDVEDYDSVGDIINYTITVANTGNVPLSNVTVTDDDAVGLDCDGVDGDPLTTTGLSIPAGGSITCTASHTVTQDDIDAGSYFNEACADDGDGGAAGDCGDVTTPADQNDVLTLTKEDDLNPAKFEGAGVVINYTITATNSGNTTLHNVTVSDNPVLANFSCTPSIPVAILAPGDSIVCTGTHTTTAADVTAGFFMDTASASSDEDAAPDADDTVYAKAQPTITTQPTLQVRDAVTIAGLTSTATYGNLTVKLVDGANCSGTTLFTKVWYGHNKPVGGDDFTGNGTYTTGWVTVSADATLRWCSAYEGDADNAARAFADDNEVVTVDFLDATIWSAAGFALAIPLMLWTAWRRRRDED